jgi:hypothetical protein
MTAKSKKYSPEVRERVVRMVFEDRGEHKSQWAAISSQTEFANAIGRGLSIAAARPMTGSAWMADLGRPVLDHSFLASVVQGDDERGAGFWS